jgi:hypothetical protein
MYQTEQTKILRFAHLAEDLVSYDSQLKEVHIVSAASSDYEHGSDAADGHGPAPVKVLSNISVRKLRETWQGLKKPVFNKSFFLDNLRYNLNFILLIAFI